MKSRDLAVYMEAIGSYAAKWSVSANFSLRASTSLFQAYNDISPGKTRFRNALPMDIRDISLTAKFRGILAARLVRLRFISSFSWAPKKKPRHKPGRDEFTFSVFLPNYGNH